MKIIYLIRVFTPHGVGGHYYSLKTTAEAMSAEYETIIISIGKNPSPAIQSVKMRQYHVHCNGLNILSVFRKVNQICKLENAELLHSFDTSAFLFGRVTSYRLKLPHLFTKCGGPNPGKAYPKVNNIICYSLENITAFKQREELRDSTIHYIPNRIDEFESDKVLLKELDEKYRKDKELIFMRIARIGKTYEKGFYQSIRFMELLKKNNIKAKLVVVGAIENQLVYQKLRDRKDDFILLTDERYTDNAKKIIEFADCIIATGRGVMEAISKKKIIFIPSDETDTPILLDKDNFAFALEKNFSPRVESQDDQRQEVEKLKRLINDIDYRDDYREFIYSKYNELFNINTVVDKYKTIYKSERFVPELRVRNLVRHFLTVTKSCLIRQY